MDAPSNESGIGPSEFQFRVLSPMRVTVQSVLPCSADQAWAEVQRSALLLEVCRPLVRIFPRQGEVLPEIFTEGGVVHCHISIFGVLPLGQRKLTFTRIDAGRREIHTEESDALFRRWDHLIRFEPGTANQCRYTDQIEIDAGLWTGLAAVFVKGFYTHRQRRWLRVAERLADTG